MHQTKDFIDPQQAIEFIQSIRTGNVIDVVYMPYKINVIGVYFFFES